MALTVRDAMALGGLRRGEVLAGANGLDRTITWVKVLESPETISWLAEGELLLTVAFAIKDDQAAQRDLMRNLARVGSARNAVSFEASIPTRESALRIIANVCCLSDRFGRPGAAGGDNARPMRSVRRMSGCCHECHGSSASGWFARSSPGKHGFVTHKRPGEAQPPAPGGEFILRQSGAEFIPGGDLQPGRTGGTGPPGEPRTADRDGEAGVPYTSLYVYLNECQGTGTVSAGCARRGLPRLPHA